MTFCWSSSAGMAHGGRAPNVAVFLSGLDVDHRWNLRIKCNAENVTADGFDVVAETWADTTVWQVWVTYVAVGNTTDAAMPFHC